MIKFLDLQKVTQKYSKEIHEAVSRVIDSGWYLQGKERSMEVLKNTRLDWWLKATHKRKELTSLILMLRWLG